MESPTHFSHSKLFTVRIWEEELERGLVEWRGLVTLVENGAFTYFRDWQTLIEFLASANSGTRTKEVE
jgi:hypothetical protein